MKKISPERLLAFLAIVLGATYMRLLPHIPNVSPIGALALFSGAIMPNGGGFALPLIVLFVSDVFLGFHTTIPYVYGSFILITAIGYVLREKMSPIRVGVGSIIGSVLFFFITNFGVWATTPLYEKNPGGLFHAYAMGLPFFRNTLLGDLFYNTLFFLGYSLIVFIIKKTVIITKRVVHYYLS